MQNDYQNDLGRKIFESLITQQSEWGKWKKKFRKIYKGERSRLPDPMLQPMVNSYFRQGRFVVGHAQGRNRLLAEKV